MGAYRLGSLKLHNFRSFEDETVKFQPSGMSLLRGFNRDTGGSSYAGKSSIPVGISVALGFCPFSIKDQQTWGAKGGMLVTQELVTDDGTWELTRGSKTSLKPPKGETITGAAAVDAKLREITGLPPEILAALTYRQQSTRGLFLTKTDAQKKDFLTTVLGLGAFEAASDAAGKAAVAAEAKMAVTQNRITAFEAQLRTIPTGEPVIVDTAGLGQLVVEMQAEVNKLAATNAESDAAITALESQVQVKIAEVDLRYADALREAAAAVVAAGNVTIPETTVEPFDRGIAANLEEAQRRLQARIDSDSLLRTQFDLQCRAMDTEIFNLKTRISDGRRLEVELEELKKKIAAVQLSKCPTCSQIWVKAKEQLEAYSARLEAIEIELAAVGTAKDHIVSMQAQRAAMCFTPDPKIERFRSIVNGLNANLEASKAEARGVIKELESKKQMDVLEKRQALSALQQERAQQISAARESIDLEINNRRFVQRLEQQTLYGKRTSLSELQLKLKATDLENDARRREHEGRQKTIAALKADIDKLKVQLEAEQGEVNAERDVEEMLGYKGFLGVIFDEILAEITEETNTILASVANTAHVAIHFVSEVVAQKVGSVPRKEIRPIVTIGGFQASLESGASGGMLTTIYLAVDLAVANVVSKRTNSWPGWMILDESFEGMDAVSKETCMEMLSKHSSNRLILVVDHASETKELFNDFIDVEFKNGRSHIVSEAK